MKLKSFTIRHFLVGPDMGEEFEVTIEKGKTLAIKTLTPGIEVKKKKFGGGGLFLNYCFLY